MNLMQSLLAASAVAAAPLAVVVADQPPAGAKTMLQVVEHLEQQGYGPFVEVEYDDGRWELEAYKQDVPYELAVDADTFRVLSEYRDDAGPRPPREALPLSQILRKLREAGDADLHDVSFERRYWEVETRRADGKHEIHLDPVTGAVIHDRRDD